jgi:hypothetical protein
VGKLDKAEKEIVSFFEKIGNKTASKYEESKVGDKIKSGGKEVASFFGKTFGSIKVK